MDKTEIVKINATEILDSRGTPTVLCKVMLSGGDFGFASVPSGWTRIEQGNPRIPYFLSSSGFCFFARLIIFLDLASLSAVTVQVLII